MSRIPSHRVQDTPESRDASTASRRVLKSTVLSYCNDAVLVTGLPPGKSALAEPRVVVQEKPVQHDVSEAVREAVAAAERSFERRLEAAVQAASETAYEKGLQAGLASAEEQLASHRALLDKAAGSFARAWDSFADHTEPLLAELSFRLSEAILGSPLPDSLRTVSTAHLSDALEHIGESGAVQVRLHPADFMALSESGIVAQLGKNHPSISWHTDASFERGDWETRSDSAVVRRVALEMLADLKEQLLQDGPSDRAMS